MNAKKTLLEKYAIPIENLDFDYIKTCENLRELEKIIEILKSGEEGYYPDLTSFAEKRLNELDPDNRMLRTEVRCLKLGTDERKEINEFVRSIKMKDRKIRNAASIDDSLDESLPPVRSVSMAGETAEAIDSLKSIKNNSKRIVSSDYREWDKYDADTECLKMDLQEEQIREKTLLEQKRQQKPQLIEVLSEEASLGNVCDVKKVELAEKHRIKGNEFFKCTEYQQAISEYNRSLIYSPTAAVYNNRAVAYLKLKKYDETIRDCEECLKRESANIKAMLRKCDALIATNRKNEAYKVYSEVLKYEPENSVAKKALKDISIRLEIQDVNVLAKQSERVYLEIPDNQGDNNDFYRKLIIT